jgi:hypothetical protein
MMAVQLHGGLGNQLFQLAFGEWLAARYNVIYYSLVPHERPGPTTRSLQIGTFVHMRNRMCLSYPFSHQITRVLCQRHVRRLAGSGLAVLNLTRAVGWPEITAAIDGASGARLALLTGYFQFSELVDAMQIHKDACFRQVVRRGRPEFEKVGEMPDFDADCLVHVRVGDYKQYGIPICGPAYFSAALEKLAEQGFGGRVFAVSDDPDSATEILAGIRHRVLTVEDPLGVLSLVAEFRYKIISNSTLSLWGALFGDSSTCAFPAVWPANSSEFARIGSAAGWTLVQ